MYRSEAQKAKAGAHTAGLWGQATCKTALTPQLGPHKRWRTPTNACARSCDGRGHAGEAHARTHGGGNQRGYSLCWKESSLNCSKTQAGNNQNQCALLRTYTSVCVSSTVIVLMKVWECVCGCVLHRSQTIVNCVAAISWVLHARFVLLCADE